MLRHYFKINIMAHNKFKEIMALTEKLPNNMELGAAVRRIYRHGGKEVE